MLLNGVWCLRHVEWGLSSWPDRSQNRERLKPTCYVMSDETKLPQARRYLRAAKWGFENINSQKLVGPGSVFHIVGIISCLRAVQHALLNHDCNLSTQHQQVVSDWKAKTADWRAIRELSFIKTSRDLLLKETDFEGYAIHSESGIGEDTNRILTDENYELIYYTEGKRCDLSDAIQSAIDWCDGELTKLEAQLSSSEKVS